MNESAGTEKQATIVGHKKAVLPDGRYQTRES